MSLKIALFVEGSPQDGRLEALWRRLGQLAESPPIDQIVGISKSDMLAMSPQVQVSGPALPLDALMAQKYRLRPFDAAIIAWDLLPPWDREAKTCRWNETLLLYRGLAESEVLTELPPEFLAFAKARHQELEGRIRPSQRNRLPCLEKGTILALCMEPVFERLLALDERALRRALGLNQKTSKWPKGWKKSLRSSVDRTLIGPAILAAQRERSEPTRKIRGDFETNKHGWASFLLEQLWDEDSTRKKIEADPLWRRWLEVTCLCPSPAALNAVNTADY